jgi:hypothetical protein
MNSGDFNKYCEDLKNDIDYMYNSVIYEFGYKTTESSKYHVGPTNNLNYFHNYFKFKNKYFAKPGEACATFVDVKNEYGGVIFGFIFFGTTGFYELYESYNSLDLLKNSMIIEFKKFGLLTAEEAIIKDIME